MTRQYGQRVRTKICGITRQQDLEAAVAAGADAVGMVFYPNSSRAVTLAQARALRKAAPAFVSVVALFVNASADEVRAVLDEVGPDLLQFHGDETPDYCRGFAHRYMRAFRVGGPGLASADEVLESCRQYHDANAWLFDSYSAGYGGSGLALDVALLDRVRDAPESRPLVLAGGLRPGNVRERIESIHPFAVDVSSGVEESPGIKSAEKIKAFIQAVRES